MARQLPADLAAAVQLGGEMGSRFAAFDWDSHPLGSPTVWPAPIRSLVAVALTSRFPIVVWLGGGALHLVYNDAYIPVLGDKHPAALGRAGREVWWDIWEPIGPMLSGVIASGEATWSDDLMLALVTEGWAQERYFTFSYSPIILASGQVDGIFCAVAETTERVLGERRLHILNDIAAALMEARTVDDAVLAMVRACGSGNPDLPFVAAYLDGGDSLRLAACSPHASTLVPDVIARPDNDGAGARDDPHLGELAEIAPGPAEMFGDNPPRQALLLPVGEPGAEQTSGVLMLALNPRRPLDIQYRGFLRLLADQLSAALSTADSYRQQHQRAEQLAELDRAKTAFLTNVSHEFRTPLTLLLGPLQDAIDATTDDPLQRDRLVVAHRNGQRLLRLVNSLLDFSRIEAGRAVISPQPLDLGAVTAQVASSFAGMCERAGIALVLDCAPVIADVDAQMWETVVLNLLSNAVKFTHQGSIALCVEQVPGAGSRVRVSDTGTGIAQHDLDRLFERFYRASNTHGRSVEGSGIGLSLVKGIVELHGGTIGIASQDGQGTTVTIELPPGRSIELPPGWAAEAFQLPVPVFETADNAFVAEAEQWLSRASSPGAPTSRRAGGALILVVDDNPDMRAHLDRILSKRWTTMVVGDGQAALDAVRQSRPDLVITDVMLPGLDGFAVTRALRDDPQLAATPVLMLSARAGAEAVGDGFTAGADDYLIKPFTTAELLHRVEARLNATARQHMLHAEQQASVRHEAAAADLSAAISTADSIDAIVAALLNGPLTATAVAVGVREPDNGHLAMHYGGDITAELRDRYHRIALDAPVPIALVAATGQPMIIPDASSLDGRFDQAVRDGVPGIPASIIHPLHCLDGGIAGALALIWAQPQRFADETLDLAGLAAKTAGQTLARITSATRERRIATGFQDHLLDLDRGGLDAVVAAVYQPATEAMRVGGDWYLSIPVRPGQVSVCVGDVVGHGLPAATVMGRLRAAVAATALTTPDPAHVLAAVQRYAATVPGAACTSLAYATVDAAARTVSYLCAGHPYPLLVTPDGQTRYLDDGRLPPLVAFGSQSSNPAGQQSMPAGSLLICYTDGLIERRGESLHAGFARLAAAASACATLPSDLVCHQLLRRLAPPEGYSDDVAILALRPTGVSASSFVVVIPAAAAELAPLRHRLSQWLTDLDLDDEAVHSVLIAAGEAAVNGIEHGSDLDPTKTISVEAFADDAGFTVSVTDSGQWRGDTAESRRTRRRGRGLTLMHGMSDRVDTHRSRQGTTVTLHFRRPSPSNAVSTGAQS